MYSSKNNLSVEERENPLVVALIPTHNRLTLLRDRCIPSILSQATPPDLIVIIDDSSPASRFETRKVIQEFSYLNYHPEFQFLINSRSRGASGAWNTGIFWLKSNFPNRKIIIALLDDDDEWEPDHIEASISAIQNFPVDLVATSFLRIERFSGSPEIINPPESLLEDDFLVGNPGIQGSNLIIKLETLIKIGGFDENFPSCTDRDLCLRLIDVKASYKPVDRVTVKHHAESSRKERLSFPLSQAKHRGLDQFWFKYRDRMSPEVKIKSCERAERLFSWQPPDQVEKDVWLLVGIISDAAKPEKVVPLLDDLTQLAKQSSISGLDVILLENGPWSDTSQSPLAEVVNVKRNEGLRIWFIPIERQILDSESGAFGISFQRKNEREGIAKTRTMLHAYLYAMSKRRPGCIVWILDDDLRLGRWAAENCKSMTSTLLKCRSDGIDVLLGTYDGAGPIPILMTIRSELLDIFNNIRFLFSLSPHELTTDRSEENIRNLRERPDAYHDLSTFNYQHSETPLWWVPEENETAMNSFHRFSKSIKSICNGEPIFRRLPSNEVHEQDLVPSKSHLRGGITWILNTEVLAETPNLAAFFSGDPCRRSDMIWAVLLEDHFGYVIKQIPLALNHDRTSQQVSEPWQDIIRDIRGHALYKAFETLLKRKIPDNQKEPLVWNQEEKTRFKDCFFEILHERIDAFERSIIRSRSLIDSIRDLIKINAVKRDWSNSPHLPYDFDLVSLAMDNLDNMLDQDRLSNALLELRITPAEPILDFLNLIQPTLRNWRMALENRTALLSSINMSRIANARSGIEVFTDNSSDLKLLGEGLEGVVYKSRDKVFKWFDSWPLRQRKKQRKFILKKIQEFSGYKSLPQVNFISEKASHLIVGYPYQESEPYQGGHGYALFRMLCECRDHGIVFNNIHPDNMRVRGDDILLVDVGADISPWTQDGWTCMIRRVWLSWRWWFRPDLRELMTRSINQGDLPELEGVIGLISVLEDRPAVDQLNDYLIGKIEASGAKSCFDFGCGKGKLAAELELESIHTVGYDPDDTLHARWEALKRHAPSVVFGGEDLLRNTLLSGEKFDAVVCSLVLCILENQDYENCLRDIRGLVEDSGRLFIVVCNPFQTFGGSTQFILRHKKPEQEYDEVFEWSCKSIYTGATRRDIHRPIRTLERDFARHGLKVISKWQSATYDTDRFEPASDFLVFELEPSSCFLPVSLTIKTCSMDHATIEEQVRHIICQLENPEFFQERLLIVDSKEDGFTRAYDTGNRTNLEKAISRLKRFGYIDRVVYSPVDPAIIDQMYIRWFGIHSSITHSANGSPLVAALTLFESVQTQYVLQVDSDVMIHRSEPRENSIQKMIDYLKSYSEAVTISLPIASGDSWEHTEYSNGKPHRIEVRGAMFDITRLLALRPLPNEAIDGTLQKGWHRSLDEKLLKTNNKSLRYGDSKFWFMHPPNHRKTQSDEWMTVFNQCKNGEYPESQNGQVDWITSIEDWLLPKRYERFVFILQGRNTPAGKAWRAIRSILNQEVQDWGAIIMDDGSEPLYRSWLDLVKTKLDSRWTVIQTPVQRRGMANLVWAIRHICTNPESIIVQVDLDDCLVGNQVLNVLDNEYRKGADLTVGSLIRTDKNKKYSVNFNKPRNNFGGNIWLHLRTFKKRLFDSVPDEAFRIDGEYIPVAQDWAFMLPMVELAQHPKFIDRILYLYEPFGDGKNLKEIAWRNEVMSKIFTKPSLLGSGLITEITKTVGEDKNE